MDGGDHEKASESGERRGHEKASESGERRGSRLRIKSRRNSEAKSKPAAVATTYDDDDLEEVLNIRVKERDATDVPVAGKKQSSRRLNQLFKDPTPAANALKENIKQNLARPLSSLLRRPGSRSAKRNEPNASDMNGQVVHIDNEHLDRIEKSLKSKESGVRAFGDGDNDSNGSVDIPLIEDTIEGGQASLLVAQAPNVAVNKVSSFQELDSELVKHAAFSTVGDIDLSLLSRFLCPENECRVESVPWTWDYLYTSICTELRDDWSDSEPDQDNLAQPEPPVTMSARSR